jgi:hypothetical protein
VGHETTANAPAAVTLGDEHHADRCEARAIAGQDRGADQITGPIAQAVHGANGKQQSPLAVLGQPLAVLRECEAVGEVIQGQGQDPAEHAAILTDNAGRPPLN